MKNLIRSLIVKLYNKTKHWEDKYDDRVSSATVLQDALDSKAKLISNENP